MIELVKKSSGAVELDKHATQIITTKYVDEQIDKVEADIAALDKKTTEKDTNLNNTINDIKNQVFENTADMAEQLENITNALFEEVLPSYDEAIEKNNVAIAETQESVEALSEEVAADIVALENDIAEINNTLPTIGGGGENPWVLIKNITTTQPITKLEFSIPANTYKEVFVRGKYKWIRKEGTSGTVYITLGSEDNKYSYSRIGNTGGTGSYYYYVVEGRVGADKYPLFTVYNSTAAYSGSSTGTNLYPNNLEASDYLPPFSIYCSSDVQFAKDGTFEIWGR